MSTPMPPSNWFTNSRNLHVQSSSIPIPLVMQQAQPFWKLIEKRSKRILCQHSGHRCVQSTVDLAAAKAVTEIFTEAVIAPGYELEAIEHLRTKKNLRIVELVKPGTIGLLYSTITGGMLVQTADDVDLLMDSLKVVTSRQPKASLSLGR